MTGLQPATPFLGALTVALASFLLPPSPAPATAEEPAASAPVSPEEQRRQRLEKLLEQERARGEAAEADGPPLTRAPDPVLGLQLANALAHDPETQDKVLAAVREYYAHHAFELQHRQSVFAWQLLSSKLIFAAVILLVFAGLYFAAIQFHVGLSRGNGPGATPEHAMTHVVASTAGIEVRSPVLGVVILVISLVFFYLYLVHVYPIEEIPG